MPSRGMCSPGKSREAVRYAARAWSDSSCEGAAVEADEWAFSAALNHPTDVSAAAAHAVSDLYTTGGRALQPWQDGTVTLLHQAQQVQYCTPISKQYTITKSKQKGWDASQAAHD